MQEQTKSIVDAANKTSSAIDASLKTANAALSLQPPSVLVCLGPTSFIPRHHGTVLAQEMCKCPVVLARVLREAGLSQGPQAHEAGVQFPSEAEKLDRTLLVGNISPVVTVDQVTLALALQRVVLGDYQSTVVFVFSEFDSCSRIRMFKDVPY
jgi:hypothetical protein